MNTTFLFSCRPFYSFTAYTGTDYCCYYYYYYYYFRFTAHSPPPAAARRGPSARQRSRQQCNASVIYPVDPGFCRIIDTFRSSSLQVSYGWKFTPTRGGTKLDGRKPRRLSFIVYNILLLVD